MDYTWTTKRSMEYKALSLDELRRAAGRGDAGALYEVGLRHYEAKSYKLAAQAWPDPSAPSPRRGRAAVRPHGLCTSTERGAGVRFLHTNNFLGHSPKTRTLRACRCSLAPSPLARSTGG